MIPRHLEAMLQVQHDICDDEDRSTEYLIATLEDIVELYNDLHSKTLDTHETVMKYLTKEK